MISLLLACLKVGALTMGGAAGMYPELAHVLVERGHWLTRDEFLYALVLCQGTPGPVVTGMGFVGVKWGGIPGGLLVMTALMAPGIAWMFLLGRMHLALRGYRAVELFFEGVRPAVPGLLAALALQTGSAHMHSLWAVGALLLSLLLILRWGVAPSLLLVIGIVGSFLL